VLTQINHTLAQINQKLVVAKYEVQEFVGHHGHMGPCAAEKDSDNPLIRDPYARMQVEAEGSGIRQPILQGYQVCRLDWPADADVYEVDQPQVREYPERILTAHGVSRRPIILFGAIGIVVYAAPFYAMVDSLSTPRLIAGMVIAQVLLSAIFAPLATLFAEMFDSKTRCTGASLGYQLAAVVGGGFTPMIASSLMIDHMRSAPLVFIAIVCGMITVVAILLIRKTRGTDLIALPRPSDLKQRPTVQPRS